MEINLLSNAITNFFQTRLKLDGTATQLVSILSLNVLNGIKNTFGNIPIGDMLSNLSNDTDKIIYIFSTIYLYIKYALVCAALYYVFKFVKDNKYIERYFEQQQKKVAIVVAPQVAVSNTTDEVSYKININNIRSSVINIHRFIQLHPEFFNTNVNQELIAYGDNHLFPVYKGAVVFDDKIHRVRGSISTVYTKEILKNDVEIVNYCIEMNVRRRKTDNSCYIKQIEKYVDYQINHGNYISLHYYKILPQSLISHEFYNNSVVNWQKDIVKLENEFFSEHKKYLFTVMKDSERTCWNNLILHGEPGTGKSSFIYRIATLTKMSILSIDLSLYINKKNELYKIFHGQEFVLPGQNAPKYPSKNCIIVLEEFDNCIDKILKIEKIFKYKEVIDDKTMRSEESRLSNNIQAAEEKSDNQMSLRPNKILAAQNDFNGIIHNIENPRTNDILRISDLLELFQGPIPIKDRIIIATTNHFEKIRDSLPALFRPGRLTPLKFTYLDWQIFGELCIYYFEKLPECEQFDIVIPTSQIVELAVKHLHTSSTIEEFLNDIIQKNTQKRTDIVLSPVQEPEQIQIQYIAAPIQQEPAQEPKQNQEIPQTREIPSAILSLPKMTQPNHCQKDMGINLNNKPIMSGDDIIEQYRMSQIFT